MNEEPLILAIGPEPFVTRVALYEGATRRFIERIEHPAFVLGDDELAAQSQFAARLATIREVQHHFGEDAEHPDAIISHGSLAGAPPGTYRIDTRTIERLRSNDVDPLGATLALELATEAGCDALLVDPAGLVDRAPVARYSGLAGIDRDHAVDALNARAVALRYAHETGRPCEGLRLIVAHLGARGISASAHRDGKIVDVSDTAQEGAFAADTAGAVPPLEVLARARAERTSIEEMEHRLTHEAGVYSYLGTRDIERVLRQIEMGDARAAEVIDAMMYQAAKDVAAMAAVLRGNVDAIIITGRLAGSATLAEDLAGRVRWIAPIRLYPGEDEMRALAEAALLVLRHQVEALAYH